MPVPVAVVMPIIAFCGDRWAVSPKVATCKVNANFIVGLMDLEMVPHQYSCSTFMTASLEIMSSLHS